VLTSLIRFVFISFLLSSAAVFSAEDISNSPEPSVSQVTPQPISNTQLPEWFYRELTSIRKDVSVLDATGASKEQIQELKERIGIVEVRLEETQLRVDDKLEAQGKYVEAINASTDRFGTLASILGLVASIIAVMFGWISAGKKAKSEAKKHVDDWLESNEAELDAQFVIAKEKLDSTLKREIASAKDQIEELIRSSKGKIETVETRMDSLENTIVERVTSSLGKYDLKNITEEELQDVEENAEEALTKSEEERTAADWKLLAVQAYFNKSFDDALSFINKALIGESPLSDFVNADLLWLKGIILGALDRFDDGIAVFNELFERFKDSQEDRVQVLVATTQINKGIYLGRLNRLEMAIVVYEKVYEQFNGNNDIAIQRQVAHSLINKAELLLVIQDKEKAKIFIQDAIKCMRDSFKGHRAMIEVLNFIVEKSTVDSVLSKVSDIPDNEIIEWSFNEIRPVVENLESPRKEQVEIFARFFEDHHDKAKLEEELAQIPNT
jgi:tetratricopeptide (TPR) repeat protein